MTDQRTTFGPFEIDLHERLLYRDGARVHVRPQVMVALCFLVSHDDRFVSRHELSHAVWPGGMVDDQRLNSLVRDLRKVLDDDPSRPVFLETIPRRGYRFTGAGSRNQAQQANRPIRIAAALLAMAGLAVIITQFVNVNSDAQALADLSTPAQRLFKEGIALYREGERLQSRSRFYKVAGEYPDFPDANLWLAKTYTSNWGARIGDAQIARPLVQKAISLNPDIPDAWTELGKVVMMTELDAAEGARLARRALQLDPGNLDARVLLIDMLLALDEADAAVRVAQELEALDPLRLAPMAAQGWISYMAGQFAEAVRQCEIALGIGLGAQSARGCLYEAHIAMGEHEAALGYARELMAADGASAPEVARVIDNDVGASNRRFLEWRLLKAEAAAASGGDNYQLAVTLQQLGRSSPANALTSGPHRIARFVHRFAT